MGNRASERSKDVGEPVPPGHVKEVKREGKWPATAHGASEKGMEKEEQRESRRESAKKDTMKARNMKMHTSRKHDSESMHTQEIAGQKGEPWQRRKS